jgi:hypothetical protein
VREREAKAAVRDRSVAIGSPTNQCRRPDVNAPKRVFNDHDPGTHNAFGDASCTPVACVSCNGETFLPGVVATDLDTEHGGTDANKRDGARQLGRLNVDDLQL